MTKWLNDCPLEKIKKSWQNIRKPQWRCRIFAIELKRQTLYGGNRPFSPLRAKLWDSIASTGCADFIDFCHDSAKQVYLMALAAPSVRQSSSALDSALGLHCTCGGFRNTTRWVNRLDTSSYSIRHVEVINSASLKRGLKWTKLTNPNHENEHESNELTRIKIGTFM